MRPNLIFMTSFIHIKNLIKLYHFNIIVIFCFSGSISQPGNNLENLRRSIPGEPEVDYPIFRTPPDTEFSCQSRAIGIGSLECLVAKWWSHVRNSHFILAKAKKKFWLWIHFWREKKYLIFGRFDIVYHIRRCGFFLWQYQLIELLS